MLIKDHHAFNTSSVKLVIKHVQRLKKNLSRSTTSTLTVISEVKTLAG